MKILVVDDSKVMRHLVMRSIRQAGHGDAEVFEAENGAEATVGFITSESSTEIKSEAIGAGASFLLTKPFEADDLEACLDGNY